MTFISKGIFAEFISRDFYLYAKNKRKNYRTVQLYLTRNVYAKVHFQVDVFTDLFY